ncbi:MAG: ADP-ribosylglycohydrolase family protein, partial [Bacteroidales bacterium]|nr:ADP-ribosylglycohydrolase family protein [Bacteroidales bacterium]
VEEEWGIEYPGTNSAVWNAGFALVAMYFGEGDFLKSVNIGYQASDYSDADCSAANVATVLAAMHGMDIIPANLREPVRHRIKGDHYGYSKLTPPVDITITELAERTAAVGIEMLKSNGTAIRNDTLFIPVQREIITQKPESFHPDEFTKWWNPEWTLSRAGFGAPGGGVRGIRGGTFLDGDILSTYPRDEVRGVRLSANKKINGNLKLTFEVAADPGRIWILSVFADHDRVFTTLVDGGDPIYWPDIKADAYPQPLDEYEKATSLRKWNKIEIDLSKYSGNEVTIRLYQDILVRNGFPGNAYWKNIKIS